jgi:hypothetical protein
MMMTGSWFEPIPVTALPLNSAVKRRWGADEYEFYVQLYLKHFRFI